MALSDIEIRNVKPAEKAQRLFDGGGLYLEVAPSGGKWWRLKYRIDGKEKRLSLGVYPQVNLKDARTRRDDAQRQIEGGIDPSAVRKEAKEIRRQATLNTLDGVTRAWLAHRAPAWTEGTLDAIRSSIETHVLPTLGSRPVSEITPRDIKLVVQAVDRLGAGETAGRVFQRLRSIFRYALSEDLVTIDPTLPLKPSEMLVPRRVRHRPSLREKEMPELFRRLGAFEGDLATKMALDLLISTGTRPGEVRGAAWEEIDWDRKLWRIPAERMKMGTEHLVPLSKQALALLTTMREYSTSPTLVFPSPFYPGKTLSENTLNSALARIGYKGLATAHGFRTLFSTCANEAGWNSDVIEKQLAHEERDDVRGAYNRAQWLPERMELMQWWADRVDEFKRRESAAKPALSIVAKHRASRK